MIVALSENRHRTSMRMGLRLSTTIICVGLYACSGSIRRGGYDDPDDALHAARVEAARAKHCEPARSTASPRPMRRFRNKWISLSLPEDAERYAFESDDVSDARPKWSGRNWATHVVIGGANLVEFTDSARLCNLSDERIERNLFIGNWIGRYGVFAILSKRGAGELDRHVIVGVRLQPDGLDEAQAMAIITSAEVQWGEPDE
jgi:hypothetical protein